MLLLGALLLTGCAASSGGERWVFENPDASDAQTRRDRSECYTLSIAADIDRRVVDFGFMQLDRNAYRACMEARGYRLRVDERASK